MFKILWLNDREMLCRKVYIAWFLLHITWCKNDTNLDYEIITFNGQNITVSHCKTFGGFSEISEIFVEHRVFDAFDLEQNI